MISLLNRQSIIGQEIIPQKNLKMSSKVSIKAPWTCSFPLTDITRAGHLATEGIANTAMTIKQRKLPNMVGLGTQDMSILGIFWRFMMKGSLKLIRFCSKIDMENIVNIL
jgi:hypothetical protein